MGVVSLRIATVPEVGTGSQTEILKRNGISLALQRSTHLTHRLVGSRAFGDVDSAQTGGVFMKDVIGRLQNRRANVLLTLRHLREQQAEVDQNTEWKDLQSQHRRRALLSELAGWYDGKLQRIDRALNQISTRSAPDRHIKASPVKLDRR